MYKKLKKYLKNFYFTKPLYQMLVRGISKRSKKQIRKNLHSYGNHTINQLENVLNKTKFLYFFDMGTLLGIVREGRIIQHDLDIDIGMHISSENERELLLELLKKNHCEHRYSYHIENVVSIRTH